MQTLIVAKHKCPQICKDYVVFRKVGKPEEKPVVTKGVEKNKDLKPHVEKPSITHADASQSLQIDDVSHSCPKENQEHFPGVVVGTGENVDFTSLTKLAGIRPGVTKYSFSRYSLEEWREHNEETLSLEVIDKSKVVDYNVNNAIGAAFGTVGRRQIENDKQLKQKAKELYRWKKEVKKSCEEITKEVILLEADRQRLKSASRTLMLPESISNECLQLRCLRSQPDLVADLVEIQLKKELEVVAKVRSKLSETLQKVEEQQDINKRAKHRMEVDWCDKYTAYNVETVNLGLNTRSNTIMFRPGATKFSEYSAPLEYWENFCRQNIADVEAVRQRSIDLRGTINSILTSGGNKLRTEADKTDIAIRENVAMIQGLCRSLEKTLQATLQRIADIEKLIEKLMDSLIKMDAAMKLAQTRLDNRNNFRAKNERVQDKPHIGLMYEVKIISEAVTSLKNELQSSNRMREDLMQKRKELERDIASKRLTLCIDRDRCGVVRSHYPSALELAGF